MRITICGIYDAKIPEYRKNEKTFSKLKIFCNKSFFMIKFNSITSFVKRRTQKPERTLTMTHFINACADSGKGEEIGGK